MFQIYVLLMKKILKNKKFIGEIINVGAEKEISIRDLIKNIKNNKIKIFNKSR